MDFSENTFKSYYYADTTDEPSDEEGTLAYKVKNAIGKRSSNNIDDFFLKAKKKRKFSKKSSIVGRSVNGGMSYISSNKDETAYASHLIKIEVFDINKLKNIEPSEHWKHADVRLKYYTQVEDDKNLQGVRNVIFNITKDLVDKEDCVKYFIQTDNKLE